MNGLIIIGAALAAGSALAQSSSTTVGNWSVDKTVDGFSDAKRGIAMTKPAKDGAIVVKCDKPGADSLYVSIISMTYLGSDRIRRTFTGGLNKYRFDEAPPADLPTARYDGRSAHLFSKDALSFLKALETADPKRLRLQLVTYDSNIVQIDFDVTGAAAAIKQTAEICEDTRFD